MDYLQHFGLSIGPFGQAANGRFFYASRQHQRALHRIYHAIQSMQGLAVLVGEIGTGKSMIARKLLYDLPEEQYRALLLVIVHSELTHKALLCKIALQLGKIDADPERHLDSILADVYERLVELRVGEKKNTVIIIDEASMLRSSEIREGFRGLLNLEYAGSKLVTFVFIGMPELDDWLNGDPALRQRVACRATLEPLDAEGVAAYISHRMEVAGASGEIFDPKACAAIYELSAGIPRVINTVCDNALLEAHLCQAEVIDAAIIASVAQGLGLGDARLFRRLAKA